MARGEDKHTFGSLHYLHVNLQHMGSGRRLCYDPVAGALRGLNVRVVSRASFRVREWVRDWEMGPPQMRRRIAALRDHIMLHNLACQCCWVHSCLVRGAPGGRNTTSECRQAPTWASSSPACLRVLHQCCKRRAACRCLWALADEEPCINRPCGRAALSEDVRSQLGHGALQQRHVGHPPCVHARQLASVVSSSKPWGCSCTVGAEAWPEPAPNIKQWVLQACKTNTRSRALGHIVPSLLAVRAEELAFFAGAPA